jgi:hypothetical protein
MYVTGTMGYGLFATEDLNGGEALGVYTGALVPFRYIDPSSDYVLENELMVTPGSDPIPFAIDARHAGNEFSRVNHARGHRANLQFRMVRWGGVYILPFVFTVRRIRRDEELTLDYGPKYY